MSKTQVISGLPFLLLFGTSDIDPPDQRLLLTGNIFFCLFCQIFFVCIVSICLNLKELVNAHSFQLIDVGIPLIINAAVYYPVRILCFYIFIDIGSDCRDSGKVFVGILNHRESTVFLSINVFLIDRIIGQFDTVALILRKRNLS